jgi:chitinase
MSLSGRTGGASSATATVLQVLRDDWETGQTNDIIVRNTGATAMNGWTVEFNADFAVTGLWDAQLVSHSGSHYVFKNVPNSAKAVIRPRTQVTFGFNTSLDPDVDGTAIREIKLNGQSLTGSGNPAPPAPNPASHGTITQSIRNFWGTGDTTDLRIQNTGAAPMSGWLITFTSDFEVTRIWNAQLIGHSGNQYTVKNIPNFWNATIKPNATATFGFNSQFDLSTDPSVLNIKLNGVLVGNPGGNSGAGTQDFTATVSPVVRAQWTDGFTNDVTILNTGTTAINGWTLTFDADFEITDVWNARIVSHVGTKYTISNIPGFWNARIAPGTGITFGFNARLDAGDATGIHNIMLNGKAV